MDRLATREAEKVGVATESAGKRLGRQSIEALQVRDFRYFLASSVAQMAGMNMQMMAAGWFMYHLTGSSARLGLTILASALPQLFLAFGGGILADRVSKKIVLIGGLLASSLIALWIALFTSLGIITWQYLVLSAFLQGAVMSLMMPARQALVPALVGRERLTSAVSLNMAGMNVNRLGAPALAGFIIAWVGVEGVYYLMAGLYLLAVVLLLPIPRFISGAASALRGRRLGVWSDLRDGLDYVRRSPDVLAVLVLTLLTIALSMPYIFLLPVFAEDVLGLGPEGLGIMISFSGIGALIGSFAIAPLGTKRRGIFYLHAVLLTGVALAALSLVNSFVLFMAILMGVGLGQAMRMALSTILIQHYTEDAYLGRVMSIFMMEWGLTGLGSFVVAVVAEYVGVQWAVGGTAGLLLLTVLFYYAFSPRIRKLD